MRTFTFAPHEWMRDAACVVADPNLFHPPGMTWKHHADQAQKALAVCRHCPVIQPCADWALRQRDDFAIAGGTTPRQRRALNKKRALA